MGQRASTGITTFNSFWAYVTPLFGAYIADTYLGRFKTISWSILICLIGHVLLILSAIPEVLEHPHGALGCFIIAVIIIGAVTGGFKSHISPLIAEQHNGILRVETRKNGERVIIDPTMTTARVYMVSLPASCELRGKTDRNCSGSTSSSMSVLSLDKFV